MSVWQMRLYLTIYLYFRIILLITKANVLTSYWSCPISIKIHSWRAVPKRPSWLNQIRTATVFTTVLIMPRLQLYLKVNIGIVKFKIRIREIMICGFRVLLSFLTLTGSKLHMGDTSWNLCLLNNYSTTELNNCGETDI